MAERKSPFYSYFQCIKVWLPTSPYFHLLQFSTQSSLEFLSLKIAFYLCNRGPAFEALPKPGAIQPAWTLVSSLEQLESQPPLFYHKTQQELLLLLLLLCCYCCGGGGGGGGRHKNFIQCCCCGGGGAMRDLSENTHNHHHNNNTKRSSCVQHHHLRH